MIRIDKILNEETGAMLTGYLREASAELPEYKNRPAVMVIPGGGYEWVSDRENEPVVVAFLQKGYQVFVLKYSVGVHARNAQPFIDGAKAMHEIRMNAKEWNVIPDKIAVCGFSAGGHLAGCLGILSGQEEFCKKAGLSAEQIRPNALILAYPVITSGEYAHRGSFEQLTGCGEDCEAAQKYSLEKHITSQVPSTFVWHVVDDTAVPIENSLMLVQELQKHKVKYEAHFFTSGGHGASMCTKEVNHDDRHKAHWIELATEWLADVFGWEA